MSRLFGTDGVRGVANKELTPLLAMQLGQAGASVLTKETSHKPTIMVGCDTRISGDMLANALMAGVCSVGANAGLCRYCTDTGSCLSDQKKSYGRGGCDFCIP